VCICACAFVCRRDLGRVNAVRGGGGTAVRARPATNRPRLRAATDCLPGAKRHACLSVHAWTMMGQWRAMAGNERQ
jgi:hypothetical protein